MTKIRFFLLFFLQDLIYSGNSTFPQVEYIIIQISLVVSSFKIDQYVTLVLKSYFSNI
ncbi:MAG: hypothetical protein ACTTNT_00085 [Arsenophonus sp.]